MPDTRVTSPSHLLGGFSLKRFRTLFQITVLTAAAITGFCFAAGWSRTSIEAYCPFGGLESAISLLTHKRFTCVAGERNLALFLALILLTLLARKSFCGWICPVGAISEWFGILGRKLFPRARRDEYGSPLHALEPPRHTDRALRWLRVLVLTVILQFTYQTGELVFRGYDPYYILFSFHGHDVMPWSYAVLAVILAGVVLFPMAWCRYLCPLGAALWPFSALGRLRLVRNEQACTRCGACDRACPHAIGVSKVNQVRSGECTLCFECMETCPQAKALELHIRGFRL